jgi:uncharacterized membrane protein
MKIQKSYLAVLIIIIASFIEAIYLYPAMPDVMAGHWDYRGEVDGNIPKFWGLFLMPILSVLFLLLLLIIPKIDPLKENIKKFRKYFDRFVVLITLFLFYVYTLSILWNIGAYFNMAMFMAPAIGIIFYYVGVLTEKSERNWFIGIRTPWTISSDKIWKKTNKLGGKLFKIAGVLAVLSIFIPEYAIFITTIPVILLAFYTIVYSYLEYKKEK